MRHGDVVPKPLNLGLVPCQSFHLTSSYFARAVTHNLVPDITHKVSIDLEKSLRVQCGRWLKRLAGFYSLLLFVTSQS